ncbi:hypothetical protein E2562_017682 [Oryza meyeriana var. granulata]|uniref:Uncharacterized protein n=1 Tax=Oryza meyeriana var. granulata TaxID=110450 RepID=A0A6G1BX49_9ORYZ|nr:hypothetical protein E2562_017682 [Oryza meyeriana var. granulata]
MAKLQESSVSALCREVAEALQHASLRAANHLELPVVYNLLGFLYRESAAHGVLGVQELAVDTYSTMAQLAPCCVLTVIAHAGTLADCHQYADAMSELTHPDKIPDNVDYGVGRDHGYTYGDDNSTNGHTNNGEKHKSDAEMSHRKSTDTSNESSDPKLEPNSGLTTRLGIPSSSKDKKIADESDTKSIGMCNKEVRTNEGEEEKPTEIKQKHVAFEAKESLDYTR